MADYGPGAQEKRKAAGELREAFFNRGWRKERKRRTPPG